jgi:hypothetical protein
MQAWSHRGLETWRYGGCGGMEARSGGLEGVQVWWFGGHAGMQVERSALGKCTVRPCAGATPRFPEKCRCLSRSNKKKI